jgi:hypothetical protein
MSRSKLSKTKNTPVISMRNKETGQDLGGVKNM